MSATKFEFTRRQVEYLRQALVLAIESLEDLIAAHRCEWAKNRRKGHVYKVIPPDFLPKTRSWRNDIKNMRRLYYVLGEKADAEK